MPPQALARPDEPAAALSDGELVDLVRGGRDSAYEELYRRHADAVRRYARSCCRDAHTAEDLTGEVFARTLQAIRGGSGPQSAVRAYLLTTVRRVAASWGSTARREQLVEDFAVFAVSAAGSSATDETEELGADVEAMHEAEQIAGHPGVPYAARALADRAVAHRGRGRVAEQRSRRCSA